MYIETSSNNHGNNVVFFVSIEQMLFKLLIKLSIIIEFRLQLKIPWNQWVILEYIFS